MDTGPEIDQFELLEEKINGLIDRVTALRKEKEELAEKAHIQEEKISDLTARMERWKEKRDRARQKIIALLEKIEQAGI
ncbi:MAG: hypothetical protein DRH56_04040 [Deltaproteobacteria bacterium]|nr:MAG: hypothetical protein DRH56_04040 [Deltaproteobacteria bacterium]